MTNLTNLAPEIRQMIYRELFESLIAQSCCVYFSQDRPYYHLVLHGTSPFQVSKTATKSFSPWALPRVCKLFQQEMPPLLDDLERHTVFDFRNFTSHDLEAWSEAAGPQRVAQMRRWVVDGVRNCADLDGLQGSDDDETSSEDSYDKDTFDRQFDSNQMFHGYSIAADLDLWRPGKREADVEQEDDDNDDDEVRIFQAHEWDVWDTGCESCFQGVDELLPEVTNDFMEEWEEAGEAKTAVDLLSQTQSFIQWNLGTGKQARKNWRAFTQRLHSGDYPAA